SGEGGDAKGSSTEKLTAVDIHAALPLVFQFIAETSAYGGPLRRANRDLLACHHGRQLGPVKLKGNFFVVDLASGAVEVNCRKCLPSLYSAVGPIGLAVGLQNRVDE